ncbi:MAG: 50S ribosomal protein L25 [marine bacterium B5-7]|nr:MAG: 50S ribosomal protein L25 [marine bacterium B5-7]
MSDFIVNAQVREETGTRAMRRMRIAKKVPAVVYGAGKDNQSIVLEHDPFMHQLEIEAFQNSILTLKASGNSQQVILREVQMHPFKPIVMHADFQRISATEKLHMSIPVHFTGEDDAPGVLLEGGIVSHLITEIDIVCLPADLPEYLEVDVSKLALGESVHLSEVTLPKDVEFVTPPEEDADHAVVSILQPRLEIDEDEAEDEEGIEAGGEETTDSEEESGDDS